MQKKRSDVPREFLAPEEQERVRAAIAAAELRTSGEIRVHVERDLAMDDPYRRAREVFASLGMHATAERNGVLFYLATRARRFAVVGDEQLHQRVGEDFWNTVRDAVAERFLADDFAGGLCAGIAEVGERLREHFPRRDDDTNELSDDVSFDA